MLRAYVNIYRNDWDEMLPAVVCAYCAMPQESTTVSPFRMMYGREACLPIDIQYEVGCNKEMPACPTAYVEWLRESLRKGHDVAREKMGKAAKKKKKSYQEKEREVQFRRGEWVWRSYPQLKPGKLQKKNVGPWLVLRKITDLNYRIQRKPEDVPQVVHVDRWTKYQPDFGVTLTSWIEDDNDPRHRATQTGKEADKTGRMF